MKRILKITSIILCSTLLIALVGCKKNKEDNKVNYELLERPENIKEGVLGSSAVSNTNTLPYLNTSAIGYGDGSYSPMNTNSDGFNSDNFLYKDGDKFVIADIKGKGVFTRLWILAVGVTNQDYISFYVDGELVIEDTYANIVSGSNVKIGKTFAVSENKGCYRVIYLSMNFEESFRIELDAPFGFWQVDYYLVDDPNNLITKTTFAEDYAKEAILLANMGEPTVGYSKTFDSDITVKANKSASVLSLDGPKQLSFLQFKIDGLELKVDKTHHEESFRDILNGLHLRIYWDGESNPSVDAPLSLLSGVGSFGYNQKMESFMYGIKDDTIYFNFPMPFRKSAKVEIYSTYNSDITLGVKIGYSDFKDSFYNVGYFTTCYSNYYIPYQDPFEAVMLNVKGSGKVVSIQENIFGNVGDVLYEEGDHRFYIDESPVAQYIGTGTEDFYNGSGYFFDAYSNKNKEGLNSFHFFGYTNYFNKVEGDEVFDGVSMYREMVTDPINFRNGIIMTFEHGGGEYNKKPSRGMNSNQTAGYEVLVCYYYQPVTKMNESDRVDLSDSTSISNHSLSFQETPETYNVESGYYGSFSFIESTKSYTKSASTTTFKMKLESDNYGAILYRGYDAEVFNQGAKVYVDNELVGEWYRAGGNEYFRHTDGYFMIPESFTKGKTEIEIKIVSDTTNPWTASEYVLYSRCDRVLESYEFLKSGDVYTISNKKLFLDATDNVSDIPGDTIYSPVLSKNNNDSVEHFRLFKYYDGSFFIVNSKTGTCLGVNNGNIECRVYPNKSISLNETWNIIKDKDGYLIQNAVTKEYLLIKGSTLVLSKDKGTSFTFTKVNERVDLLF